MSVEVDHVSLQEESVPERLLSPVVVPDPLPVLPNLASNAQVPVIVVASQADIFDRIPGVVAVGGIPQKTPVLGIPQQIVTAIRPDGAGTLAPLGRELRNENEQQGAGGSQRKLQLPMPASTVSK